MKEVFLAMLCLCSTIGGVSFGARQTEAVAPSQNDHGHSGSVSSFVLKHPIAISVAESGAISGYLIVRYSVELSATAPSPEVLGRVLPGLSTAFFFQRSAVGGLVLSTKEYLELADDHAAMITRHFPTTVTDVRLLQIEYFSSKSGRKGVEFATGQ